MKRLLAALTLALFVSLVVGAGVAFANHGTDYARGTVDQGGQEWRFSASSNFNGTDPQGQVRLIQENQDPNFVVTGEVTCLRVVGSTAFIVAEITDIRGGTNPALQSMIIQTTDGGKLQNFPPDTFGGFASVTPATELGCTTTAFQQTVQDGQVVVHDSF
jgi:hypothetical protein